jgi:hypothetical protein
MDLRSRGWILADLFLVVYCEDQWWVLEKMFMNIRVPLKALHFMT